MRLHTGQLAERHGGPIFASETFAHRKGQRMSALTKWNTTMIRAGMRDMTQSNQWFTMKQPDYLMRTTNYQKSVEAFYMAAVDKNLEAATEAYTKVARNCVECHRLVRTEQRR